MGEVLKCVVCVEESSLYGSGISSIIVAITWLYEGRMAQSRRGSLIEAVTNTVVGYVLAVATQFAVFPIYGLKVGVVENLGLGLAFTAVSLIRGYVLRRLFDRWRL